VIHLYAFVRGLRSLPDCLGVGEEPLEIAELDGVTAVVGSISAPAPQSPEAAVAHGKVVEALVEHADAVLPARLGAPFPDRAALAAAAGSRAGELRERLLRVSGCIELAVRVASGQARDVEASDGTTYLLQLARRAAAAASAHEALSMHALESRVRRSDGLLRASYLIRRGDVESFARRVDQVADGRPELAIVCTGPWAPYSFAEAAV
jgi:hypothetical protein